MSSESRRQRQFSATAASAEEHVQAGMCPGFAFGDLLAYLGDKVITAQENLEERLTELAKMLGYEDVAPDTKIRYADTTILCQEIGAVPPKRKELQQFVDVLRAKGLSFWKEEEAHPEGEQQSVSSKKDKKKRPLLTHRTRDHFNPHPGGKTKRREKSVICDVVNKEDLTPEEAMLLAEEEGRAEEDRLEMTAEEEEEEEAVEEDLEAYFDVKSTKELMTIAKKRGDKVEVENKWGAQVQVIARVITQQGSMVHFKPLGKWTKDMKDEWKSHMLAHKDYHIHACKDFNENPTTRT